MKKLVIFIALLFFVFAPLSAMAGGCPPGQSWKGSPHWKCMPDPKPENPGTTINNTNTNTAKAENNIGNGLGNFSPTAISGSHSSAKGGDGGDATVKGSGNSSNLNINTAKGGDAKVTGSGNSKNTNVMGQKSENTNVITIEGDTTNVEADKREHIQGAGLTTSNANVVDAKASNVRAKGDLLSKVKTLTYAMAKKASKNASDMEVEPALLWENDFRTELITVGIAGEFAGYIYIFSDGDDSYLAAMDAEAAEEAMEAGMTHIKRLGPVETSKHLSGTAWNIGLSGGASIMSDGENLALAPQGGLSYGKADSTNLYRPDAVYEISFDKSRINAKIETSKSDRYMYTAR